MQTQPQALANQVLEKGPGVQKSLVSSVCMNKTTIPVECSGKQVFFSQSYRPQQQLWTFGILWLRRFFEITNEENEDSASWLVTQ